MPQPSPPHPTQPNQTGHGSTPPFLYKASHRLLAWLLGCFFAHNSIELQEEFKSILGNNFSCYHITLSQENTEWQDFLLEMLLLELESDKWLV